MHARQPPPPPLPHPTHTPGQDRTQRSTAQPPLPHPPPNHHSPVQPSPAQPRMAPNAAAPQRREGGGWRDELRPTGTDDVQCRAAGSPGGSRAGQSRTGTWLPWCRRWPCRCWLARQVKCGLFLSPLPHGFCVGGEEKEGEDAGTVWAGAPLAAVRARGLAHGRAAEQDQCSLPVPGLHPRHLFGQEEEEEEEEEEGAQILLSSFPRGSHLKSGRFSTSSSPCCLCLMHHLAVLFGVMVLLEVYWYRFLLLLRFRI